MKYFVVIFVIAIFILTVWFFISLIKNIMNVQSKTEERREIEAKDLENKIKQDKL